MQVSKFGKVSGNQGAGAPKTNERNENIMNSEEITRKINQDLPRVPELEAEITKIITPPVIGTFTGMSGKERQLWIIGKSEGYYLTYDETTGRYGLGYKTIQDELVFLRSAGSISDAYTLLMTD